MRWLKIYTDGQHGEKESALFALPFPDNHVASSVWLRIRQVVGLQVKFGQNRDVAYSIQEWAARLNLSVARTRKFLQILERRELIQVSIDDDDLKRTRVLVPDLLFFADETAEKFIAKAKKKRDREAQTDGTNSGTDRESVGSLREAADEDESEAKRKDSDSDASERARSTRAARPSPLAGGDGGGVSRAFDDAPNVKRGGKSLRQILRTADANVRSSGDSRLTDAEEAFIEQYGYVVDELANRVCRAEELTDSEDDDDPKPALPISTCPHCPPGRDGCPKCDPWTPKTRTTATAEANDKRSAEEQEN